MEKYELAENELDKEIAIRQKMPQDNSDTAQTDEFLLLINKGHLYLAGGEYHKAEEYYILPYNKIKPLYENNSAVHYQNYRVILESLVNLYSEFGKKLKANKYLRKLNKMKMLLVVVKKYIKTSPI